MPREIQVGAIPFRRTRCGKTQILLITARSDGRWIIPKGGRSAKLSEKQSAALEALEEAGVRGRLGKAVGSYSRRKKKRGKVRVYLLNVTHQALTWKEQHQRSRRWVSPSKARRLVEERPLRRLLREAMD